MRMFVFISVLRVRIFFCVFFLCLCVFFLSCTIGGVALDVDDVLGKYAKFLKVNEESMTKCDFFVFLSEW